MCNQLVATFSNVTNPGSTFAWDFGDGDTSNLENPVHTYASNGNYTATLTVTNPCGTDSTSIFVQCLVGVEESASMPWDIYPNPVQGIMDISGIEMDACSSFVVLDLYGRELLESETPPIDVSVLASGLYLLRISMEDDRQIVLRFIKE
jgi:hypothetical protein